MQETLMWSILFWCCVGGLVHTYLLYPLLMKVLSLGKKPHNIIYTNNEDLPFVSVLMSLYNEEAVIENKLNSLLLSDYPAEKLHLFIGSDCSADRTNEIVAAIQATHPAVCIHFFPFEDRRGKPAVLNDLHYHATLQRSANENHILLITDANVMLEPQTIKTLVRHFKDPNIAIVDAHMTNTGMRKEGISTSENTYINREVWLKHLESVVWQKMIGPFGGCYTIRSTFFAPIPTHFLVDDFFVCMRVFEQKGNAINDLEAVCYEAVSHEIKEEYRRKARISAGNYQNAQTFWRLWLPPIGKVNFAFFSHKILRWLGPYFIIGAFLFNMILAYQGSSFYQLILVAQLLFLIGIPVLDLLLKTVHINVMPFRSVRYFLWMNLALLEGLFKFMGGVKSGAWEPPKRV